MMIEVQSHGFVFEEWVKRTCFGDYAGMPTQEWDIPAEHNSAPEVHDDLRNLPVSVKISTHGSPINLGDALRQRNIDVCFLMIVGFWTQRTDTEKWIEDIGVAKFTAHGWRDLWGTLDAGALEEIDSCIKDPSVDHTTARKLAQDWKKKIGDAECQIVINPKIDSKSQRRIQCSLPFNVFWAYAGREPRRVDSPDLFGHEFPNPIQSRPREFTQT